MREEFPERDSTLVAVNWAPLIVKPIPTGPECFVAAIAARSDTGEAGCHRLADRSTLNAMFKEHAVRFGAVIDISVESLTTHVRQGRRLAEWNSPFEGVYLGEGATSFVQRINDAYVQAARACSLFSGTQRLAPPRPSDARPWDTPVTDVVRRLKPALANSLNAQLNLGSTTHAVTFHFYGVHLAANVVVLNGRRLSTSLREARAHLWNLSLIADAPDLLFRPDRLELFAGAREDSAPVRSAIQELAFEASWRHVNVTRVESSEDAARQIVARAA